jgi:hypothetical protein
MRNSKIDNAKKIILADSTYRFPGIDFCNRITLLGSSEIAAKCSKVNIISTLLELNVSLEVKN